MSRETFEEFRARRDRARAREGNLRVTWRRVSADTGGGWSGIGPGGALVWVARGATGFDFGDYADDGSGRKVRVVRGTAERVLHAKRGAARLVAREEEQ